MANSEDPDQLASCKGRAYLGSVGLGLRTFFCLFYKVGIFCDCLFAFSNTKPLLKRETFLIRTLFQMEGRNNFDRAAYPESILVLLKISTTVVSFLNHLPGYYAKDPLLNLKGKQQQKKQQQKTKKKK